MSSQIGVGSSSTLEEDGAAQRFGASQTRPGARRAAVRRRRLWLGAITLAVAVGAALLAKESTPRPAAPGPVGTGGEPGTGGVPTSSVSSQRQSQSDEELARYWTPERRAHAVDGDVAHRAAPGDGHGDQPAPAGQPADVTGGWANPAAAGAHGADLFPPEAAGPAVALPGAAVPGRIPLADSVVAPYRGGGLAARAEGALFSTIGGVDYACSGTVVDSPGGDLVLTAGHCLHEGGAAGGFATNVIFIPGYANGAMPYGAWHARQLTVTNAWGYRQDFDEDAGFAAFRPLGGQSLAAAVGGGFPIAFGSGRQPQTVLGYPKLAPYDGSTLMFCSGTPAADPHGGTSLGVRCAMTAGASGGAWFTGFGGGGGTVDSVVSYAYASDPSIIYGTWFGSAIQSLYRHAIGL